MDLRLRPYEGDFFGGDLVLDYGDLALEDGLITAVLISLFTDRRAEPGDVLPDAASGPRGWWGDGLNKDGDLIGSRLWLLEREKVTPETRQRYEDYARESLAWLLTDGLAKAVDVSAAWGQGGLLILSVDITRPDNVHVKYSHTWDCQKKSIEVISRAV